MPRIELERFEREEDRDEISLESFDRLAFAAHMVALIRPRAMRVAIFGGSRLRVETGRQWGEPGAQWATVEISARASRQAIVRAILGIRGEGEGEMPFSFDLLMRPYR